MSHFLSPIQFDVLPLEAKIRLIASELLGWRYGTGKKSSMPRVLPGIPETMAVVERNTRLIDCSTLTAFVLTHAYPSAPWDLESYKDLQIYDPKRPFSPIDAVVRAGVGGRVGVPIKRRWHLMQTWNDLKDLSKGGHSRLVRCRDGEHLDVLESTNADKKVGARWSTLKWSEVSVGYDGVKLALLNE